MQRPDFYFSSRNGAPSVELTYCMPPLLQRAFGSSEKVVYQLQRGITDTERACKARRKLASGQAQQARPVLGAEAVMAQHPWAEPRSPRRFSRGPTPVVKVGLDGDDGNRELAKLYTHQHRKFIQRHKQARLARLAGEAHLFPHGTYAFAHLHNAPVESADQLPDGPQFNAPGALPEDLGEYNSTQIPIIEGECIEMFSQLREAAQAEASTADPGDFFDYEDAAEQTLEDSQADSSRGRLAKQIVDGQHDAVDRRASTTFERVMIPTQDSSGNVPASAPANTPLEKRVILRNSTAAARTRRLFVQQTREKAKRAKDTKDTKTQLPDPPPS